MPLLCPDYAADGIERAVDGRVDGRIVRLAGFRVPFDREDRWVPAARFRAAAAHVPDFDLVHIQTPFAAHRAGVDLARRRGVPVVETYHTYFEHYFEHYLPFLPAGLCRRIARRLTRKAARELDRMVVPSTAMRDALAAYGVTTPMSVIPTGIRPGSMGAGDGTRFRARHAIAADRPVLVHVGRIGHEKNLLFLLQAFERVVRALPAALMVVAGEGPARSELQRVASALGLDGHLLWLGYLDRERELADCYRGGDAFVFTSKTETQGLVLLEAMTLGVPVVALAEMGTSDLLLERRGALVAESDRRRLRRQVPRGAPRPRPARPPRRGRPARRRRLVGRADGRPPRRVSTSRCSRSSVRAGNLGAPRRPWTEGRKPDRRPPRRRVADPARGALRRGGTRLRRGRARGRPRG